MSVEVGTSPMGIYNLLSVNTGVGLAPLIMLAVMSIGVFYYSILKGYLGFKERMLKRSFDKQCDLSDHGITVLPPSQLSDLGAWGRLTCAALLAMSQLAKVKERPALLHMDSPDEFLQQALRHAITTERVRLEHGLAFLASVGSAAPFIGLFGTVWGIYHALLAIGAAGQSSLDKVAGPVGEALIMTGFGLAVALPAVLLYNFFVRRNRLTLVALEGFAYDLYISLMTSSDQVSAQVPAAHDTVELQIVDVDNRGAM